MSEQDACWLVVKFISDLRRQECVNVGVLLEVDGTRLARFRGQRRDGLIDARQVKWTDVDNWRRWVEYWEDGWIHDRDDVEAMISTDPSSNFRVVAGGRFVQSGVTRDPLHVLDELYSTLVAGPNEQPEAPSVRLHHDVRQLMEAADLLPNIGENRPVKLATGREVTFDWVWSNGTQSVGHELATVRTDFVDALTLRVTLLPKNYGAVVFVPAGVGEDPAVSTLEKAAYVAEIGAVSPDDVRTMFKSKPARKLVLSS